MQRLKQEPPVMMSDAPSPNPAHHMEEDYHLLEHLPYPKSQFKSVLNPL